MRLQRAGEIEELDLEGLAIGQAQTLPSRLQPASRSKASARRRRVAVLPGAVA